MSAGEVSALIQGFIGSRRRHSPHTMSNMVPPDNRCCFCLTLQTGTVGIGIGYCLLYMAIFTGCILFPDETGLKDHFSLTWTWFLIGVCGIEIVMNVLLVCGAIRKVPRQLSPWIILNAIILGICMISIVITVFFGTNKMELTYSEYVTSLITLGLITGINIFCCIVVFQFRHNIIMERQMELNREFDGPICSSDPVSSAPPLNPPPPSYDEVEHSDYKIVNTEEKSERIQAPMEDGPPEYEEAINSTGPVQRKKSLTNNAV